MLTTSILTLLILPFLFVSRSEAINFKELQEGRESRLQEGYEKFYHNSQRWTRNMEKFSCFAKSNFTCQTYDDTAAKQEWKGGCAPSFLVIGAPKGGTTSLYEYLTQHPQISRALSGIYQKEVRYFSEWFSHPFHDYVEQFPPIKPSSVNVNGDLSSIRMISGEASPTYLFEKVTPQLVKNHLPNAKLIVMLREPIARLWSWYNMAKDQIPLKIGFEQHMIRQMKFLNRCFNFSNDKANWTKEQKMEAYFSGFNKPATSMSFYTFLLESMYVHQIRNWLKFFPRSQLLILKSEEFFAHPMTSMEKVSEFLGLCPIDWKEITQQAFNKRANPNNTISAIQPDVLKVLKDLFKPLNEELEQEIGITLEEWDYDDQMKDKRKKKNSLLHWMNMNYT